MHARPSSCNCHIRALKYARAGVGNQMKGALLNQNKGRENKNQTVEGSKWEKLTQGRYQAHQGDDFNDGTQEHKTRST